MGRVARVAALQGLALQLSGEGRVEESLAAVQEAVAIAGRLRFGAARFVQADLVHTKAHVLFDAGRWEEAADAARAAIAARRDLGAMDSDQLSRLSDSIEVLANSLTRLRRLDEADAASAEVVAMRARLPWADRARALLNRAAVLTDAGRHEEGLAVATELVRSAPTRGGGPDLGDPALVDGLVNLAVLLRLNGRWQDAVSVQALAVDQLRPAAADACRLAASADLAVALANQSLMHLEMGRPGAAEAPGQEALDIRERLARHSGKHLEDLSDSLNNQAIVLDRLGRTEEAEVLASRSVELRRRLHERQPAAHERRLANALGTHCHMLTACGRPEAGVVAGREAVDRLRRLADIDPATAPWLAGALDSLAAAGAAAGLDAECLAASREAVDTGRRAARSSPSGFGGTYAEILLGCAERCRPIAGVDPDECLAWVREAVDLLGVLGADEPEAYELLLERARGVLAGWAARDEP